MSHGPTEEKRHGGATMAKDPVCGMRVDEKKAVAKAIYERRTYYFCAQACKRAFEKNPEKYTKKIAGSRA